MSEVRDAYKKQFIAGAICPDCKEADSVQLWHASVAGVLTAQSGEQPATKKMVCVACGYEEELKTGNTQEIFRGNA